MSRLRLDRLLEFLAGIEPMIAMLWLGLAIFTVGLAILMYTRWGQYRPLRKCMALSLFAHLLMGGYATTVEIVTPIPHLAEQIVHVSLGDGPDENAPAGGSGAALAKANEQPWEVFPGDAVARPGPTELERGKIDPLVEPTRVARTESTNLPGGPTVDHVAVAVTKSLEPKTTAIAEAAGRSLPLESAESIDAPAAQRRDAAPPLTPDTRPDERLSGDAAAQPVRTSSDDVPAALLQQIVPLPKMSETEASQPLATVMESPNPVRLKPVERVAGPSSDDAYASGNAGSGDAGSSVSPHAADAGRFSTPSISGLTGQTGGKDSQAGIAEPLASNAPDLRPARAARGSQSDQPIPDAYRLRVAPNRGKIAQSHGGTAETEAAVKAALKWLADNQAADGRWDPRAHEAGRDRSVLGRNRPEAGSRADTAMTGLALLAFLGSGHTHLDGPYREDVRRGLEFLMRLQAPDGNLGGPAAAYEFMYSHAMATCALSEAYGMTHDRRLREPVRRAIGYTIAAQDPRGGGWRYRPGDPGDTSQLGWQLMSLKSAELAGIPMPDKTRQGIVRYLQSVASGSYGGRASYRPGEPATRTMTAEALVCWQFLGLARENRACNEAGDYLIGELPGEAEYNLYYWYYATLGMYQLHGTHWQRWNNSLRSALLSRQVRQGPQAGSWDTSDVWGGHGGRVYTTALATLTLEVYYRFLPLYAGAFPEEESR